MQPPRVRGYKVQWMIIRSAEKTKKSALSCHAYMHICPISGVAIDVHHRMVTRPAYPCKLTCKPCG